MSDLSPIIDGRTGGVVHAAQCAVVSCWNAVLPAWRGLERVERRHDISRSTCAPTGPAWALAGAGGKRNERTSVLCTHVHHLRGDKAARRRASNAAEAAVSSAPCSSETPHDYLYEPPEGICCSLSCP